MTHSTHTAVHIPDEAVQAAIDAYGEEAKKDINYFHVMMRAALTAALPHLPTPCAVEVKKLEWKETGKGRDIYSTVSVANCEFGSYYIGKMPSGNKQFSWDNLTNGSADGFETQDQAKAAAQADFDRRILSCVVTKPDAPTTEQVNEADT